MASNTGIVAAPMSPPRGPDPGRRRAHGSAAPPTSGSRPSGIASQRLYGLEYVAMPRITADRNGRSSRHAASPAAVRAMLKISGVGQTRYTGATLARNRARGTARAGKGAAERRITPYPRQSLAARARAVV